MAEQAATPEPMGWPEKYNILVIDADYADSTPAELERADVDRWKRIAAWAVAVLASALLLMELG